MSESASAGAAPARGHGRAGLAAWCALATAGISFWFLIGFPFGHHNESYDWVAWIGTPDLGSVAWHRFFGSGGYRPLSMSLAWAFYHLGDGSLVPIQLFNFALTLLAWWTLCTAAVMRRTFAIAALVGGGVLFSGYIFLFHLHGVFYGPLLLWLALAIRGAGARLGRRTITLGVALTILAVLAHTFALALGLAFVAGAALERGWLRDRRRLVLAAVAMALGIALIAVAAPSDLWRETGRGMRALIASFRTVEVNGIVAVVAGLFALATVATTRWPGRAGRAAALVATIVSAALAVASSVPVVLVWLVAGGVKAIRHGRWTLAALLAASLALPYAGASGSPTYALFAIALLTWIVALDAEPLERRVEGLQPGHALAASAILVGLAFVIRSGIEVPVLSRLARPVLAEKERTHQAERLLKMVLASSWRQHPVRLAEDALAPTVTGGAIDRRERAPTQQICLDAYLFHQRGHPDSTAAPVVLSFGGGGRYSGNHVFIVPGRHAGPAMAYLAPHMPPGAAAAPD